MIARSTSNRLGFTLVELMVVVLLIGILGAVMIPEMKGTFTESVLRATSRDLVNAFELAYSRTVSFNQVHRVKLDRTAGKYRVERLVHQDGRRSEFAPVKDVPGAEGTMDERIQVEVRKSELEADGGHIGLGMAENETATADAQALSFFPDGTAERGEVRLRDRTGHGLLLQINPTTARVHVVELKSP